MRRIALSLFLLALLLGPAGGSPPPAAAQGGDGCQSDICRLEIEIQTSQAWQIPGREARRCTGTYRVGMITRGRQNQSYCAEVQVEIDCAGNVQVVERFGEGADFCPTANAAWKAYCDPVSRMGDAGGFCDLVDYYGNRIRLKVEVPKHRFRIVPYPVGFVAREDPWGVFHPTARLVWETPPFPQYADSGWRLWTWGGNRGPGSADFPCDLDEAGLLARNVPAGTECLRLQLWASPGFQGLEPTLLPGLLQYPAARVNMELMPGREVAINFPYASHPATGEVSELKFGDQILPAFNGYFNRWWPVRLRVEKKTVRDITGTECHPVAADEKGKPKEGGDCWVTLGDPPALWPGKQVTVVKEKKWEAEKRDDLLQLNLDPFNRPWPYLHPDGAIIRGADRTWRTGVIVRGGYPWLYLPLAVREGQGVVTR